MTGVTMTAGAHAQRGHGVRETFSRKQKDSEQMCQHASNYALIRLGCGLKNRKTWTFFVLLLLDMFEL